MGLDKLENGLRAGRLQLFASHIAMELGCPQPEKDLP